MELLEIISEYNNYVPKIPKGALIVAEKLREDKLNEALKIITDFSEGVMWLSKVSEVLSETGVNIELDINQIKDFLNEINLGLEKRDFVLVADIFEYEIAPYFESINEIRQVEQ